MPPTRPPVAPRPSVNSGFCCLLYRFFFFDWLFADLGKATSRLERHAAWRHNREMRKYLPIYLRRWSVVSVAAFLTGSLCDRVLQAEFAASCCFTGFGATVGVMAVIAAAWLFMSDVEFR